MRYFFSLFVTSLLLVGCGKPRDDIHSETRETKAYETASVELMDQAALMIHLNLLAGEMSLATQQETYSEMHHIEIALSKALTALESKLAPRSIPTIGTLKIVATKIHETGHGQNKSMAIKLDQTLRAQIDKLRKTLARES